MTDVVFFDHLLSDHQVADVIDVWHRYPGYRTVGAPRQRIHPWEHEEANESLPQLDFAPKIPERGDLGRNRRLRALASPPQEPAVAGRDLYLREAYAELDVTPFVGIESFLTQPGLAEAAADLFDAEVVVPCHVYANLLLPGQELGVHTDVPEFRGASRHQIPLWLLVVMHHSGLFERWRLPIATAVMYVTDSDGGDLFYYREPSDRQTFHPKVNSGIMFDADTIYHGISRVAGDGGPLSDVVPGARLQREGRRFWRLYDRPEGRPAPLASYDSDQLRFSVSWKAFCFRDEADYERWRDETDNLHLEDIVPLILGELEGRGRPPAGRTEEQLATAMIDEFVKVPAD